MTRSRIPEMKERSSTRRRPREPAPEGTKPGRAKRALKDRLDALVKSTDHGKRRDADPVGFVHRYADPNDQELVALIAALLAFGNVLAIRKSVERVLLTLGDHPADTVDRASHADLDQRLRGFVHRVWRGEDVAHLLANAASLRR